VRSKGMAGTIFGFPEGRGSNMGSVRGWISGAYIYKAIREYASDPKRTIG